MSGEEVKMGLEMLSSIAVIVASGAAIYGIFAWKKEFQGKRNIELAEDVLALFYEAKDAIRAIRCPLSHQGEGAMRESQQAIDTAIIYERYEKRQGIFNKLGSKRYQFKARFGTEKDKPFEDLNNIIIDIRSAADGLSMTQNKSANNDNSKDNKDWQKYMSVIYLFMPDDPITPRVNEVISDIEAICKHIITGNK